MSANTLAILKTYGQIGVDVIKQSIHRATGKTEKSVRYIVTDSKTTQSLQILAREFIQLLEKGRRPTTKGPSREMIDNLTEYAQARGMEDTENAAWAIAKTINKEGDKTFRMGGKDVYSQAINKLVNELEKEIIASETKFVVSEIVKNFKSK